MTKVTLPKASSSKPAPLDVKWLEHQTSQGYNRVVYKRADNSILIKKSITNDDEYIHSLFPEETAPSEKTALIGNPKLTKFTDSFKTQRQAMVDLEGLFFYHYAQVTSSIKAQYQFTAEKDIEESIKQARILKAEIKTLEQQVPKLADDTLPIKKARKKKAAIPLAVESADDELTIIKKKKKQLERSIAKKKKTADIKLKENLNKIDEIFEKFANETSNTTQEKFKELVQQAIEADGSINVAKLNNSINEEIKELKKGFDTTLKAKLEKAHIIIAPKDFRKITNAFNTNVTDITETPLKDGKTFIEQIESTTITSHDKKNGPAVSKITMIIRGADGKEDIVYQGYRTSHLVTNPVRSNLTKYTTATMIVAGVIGGLILACSLACPPLGFVLVGIAALCLAKIAYDAFKNKKLIEKEQDNIENTEGIIEQFMNNARTDTSKPMIYNLFTSTHAGVGADVITGFSDYIDNQQTQRLRTLTDAQFRYNSDKTQIKDMFFTLNTPTNTYGKEISLARFPSMFYPHMHKVAQSNLIALAILLYPQDKTGKYNEDLQKMVLAYQTEDSAAFQQAYNELKTQTIKYSDNKETKQAQKFLLERFKEDTAAHHQYAKESATCIGILSQGKANLIAGCKSGNERTGGILGRIATFFSSIYTSNEDQVIFSPKSKGPYAKAVMIVTGVIGGLILAGCISFPPAFALGVGIALLGIAALCLAKIAYDWLQEKPSYLDQVYNDTGCFSASVTGVSLNDQGAPPKTEAKTWFSLFFFPNTNHTESIPMTKIITKAFGSLQAHKDKEFQQSTKELPDQMNANRMNSTGEEEKPAPFIDGLQSFHR